MDAAVACPYQQRVRELETAEFSDLERPLVDASLGLWCVAASWPERARLSWLRGATDERGWAVARALLAQDPGTALRLLRQGNWSESERTAAVAAEQVVLANLEKDVSAVFQVVEPSLLKDFFDADRPLILQHYVETPDGFHQRSEQESRIDDSHNSIELFGPLAQIAAIVESTPALLS